MKEKLTVKKIIVLGCSGSGKSTFARKLRELTGLPLIHLDNVWWKADRSHITRDEFDKALDRIIRGGEWIIDGDYSRTYEVRIRACETVIFLDYSEEECMNGIIERVGKERPDIPWTENTLDPELVKLVKEYRTENYPKLMDLFEKYSDKQIIIFKSRSEADKWLENEASVPKLRKAERSDIETVVSLYRAAVGSPGCTWNEYYPTSEEAETDFAAGCLYVYENGGEIVGCVSVVPENELDEMDCWNKNVNSPREIARITIAEGYRGQGLAAKMLAELFELLKSDGCDAIRLLVAICNPAALKTYENLGFSYLTECEMYGNRYFAGEKIL